MGIGYRELIVILLIVLLLFGARKIPDLAKSLATGIREFRKAAKETNEDETKSEINDKNS
jgi:sec-independent protein translocase protein TatA